MVCPYLGGFPPLQREETSSSTGRLPIQAHSLSRQEGPHSVHTIFECQLAQAQTMYCSDVRECARTVRSLFNQKDSFDDFQAMLETLMLLSALMLAFAISGLQSVQHDDLVAGDERRLGVISALVSENPDSRWREHCLMEHYSSDCIASYKFLRDTYLTITCMVSVLMPSCAMYLSLCISSARENEIFFGKWVVWFQVPLVGCFVLFTYGVFSFFSANHTFIDLTFPMYDMRDLRLEDVYSDEAGMKEGGYWSHQFLASQFRRGSERAIWTALGLVGFLHFGLTIQHWIGGGEMAVHECTNNTLGRSSQELRHAETQVSEARAALTKAHTFLKEATTQWVSESDPSRARTLESQVKTAEDHVRTALTGVQLSQEAYKAVALRISSPVWESAGDRDCHRGRGECESEPSAVARRASTQGGESEGDVGRDEAGAREKRAGTNRGYMGLA